MQDHDLDRRVDEAVEEMRSGTDELEERRDELARQADEARAAARRARDEMSPGTSRGGEADRSDDDAPTAEERDAVDESSDEED